MSERFYRVVQAIARFLFGMFFPLDIEGLQNISADRPALLCSNHVSLRDPIVLACALDRPIHFIGKRELFKSKLARWFFGKLGAFPVARGGSDLAAMRTSLAILKNGGLLGIFPQGHRYIRDDHREIETGAALMALRTRVDVIPVHIAAPYRPLRKLRIRFGAPVGLHDLNGKLDSDSLREATLRIQQNIWQEPDKLLENR